MRPLEVCDGVIFCVFPVPTPLLHVTAITRYLCTIYVDSRLGKFCLWFLACDCDAAVLTCSNPLLDALLVPFPCYEHQQE